MQSGLRPRRVDSARARITFPRALARPTLGAVSNSNATASGSCFCGAVRFTAVMPTIFCGHCHCSMCRRAHGAGYVTWFAVARSQFKLDDGDEQLVRFQSSDHGTRSFCGRCGSTLFCETTHYPDMVDIVLANMDEPIDRPPQAHFFFENRVDWVHVDDELPRLGGPDWAK
ncbi:MAG: GFA family protein [Deltaproteobacteria bacterium]|nr:MAG: GFA family protein [Deltaproteobacteria bacterium]